MDVTVFGYGTNGGMHHYAVQLANGLTHHVDVSLVIPENGDATTHIHDEITVKEYTIPAYVGTINKATAAINLHLDIYRCVKDTNPTIIHNSFIGPTVPSICVPLFKTFSVPVISTLHDPIKVVGDEISYYDKKWYNLKNRFSISVSDLTLVHGESTMAQARQAGHDLEQMDMVPHGKYDLFKMYDYNERQREPNTLLFFGSIRPEKGFDRVTRILDHIEQEVPDISAIVAGKPLESQKDVVEQLRKDDRVELHAEYISNDKVGEFFSRASVVVLPYYRATSSGVLMTAYTFEKPVVATRVGDIEDLVMNDDVGFVADDVGGISKAVIKLLTNPTLYGIKKGNMVAEAEKYTWDVIGQKISARYRSVSKSY